MVIKGRVSGSHIWLMWGVLDLFHIVWYAFHSLMKGRVPYLEDMISTTGLMVDQDVSGTVYVIASWVLECSIAISCVLFLGRWRVARWLGWAQIPLRLAFMVPSLSVLFIGPNLADRYGIVLLLCLLVFSECLKGWTLWAAKASCSLR